MRKALISLVLCLFVSVGFILTDTVTVSAESEVMITSIGKSGTNGYFQSSVSNYKAAIIEYTFVMNDITMSRLLKTNIYKSSSNQVMTEYTFTLPDEALSFKVWRVIDTDVMIKSTSGLNEYIQGTSTFDSVQTRIKTVYITEDLITREIIYPNISGVINSKFTMHFNIEDEVGNEVPIDYIHSVRVKFDIVKESWFLTTTTPMDIVIEDTSRTPITIWPFVLPPKGISLISPSNTEEYTWSIILGEFPGTTTQQVSVADTSIITIDYYYNGVFYQDVEVVDEPYDADDIVDLPPSTSFPNVILLMNKIVEWILNNPGTAATILFAIIALLILVKLLSGVKMIIQMLVWIIKGLIKTLIFIIKYSAYAIGGILYFIVFLVPKALFNMFYFLFTPKEKRKLRRKENIIYVNRSI